MRGKPTDPVSPLPRRSRWPAAAGALVLLWCAGWYCRGGDAGLLIVAAAVAAIAVALPRALPGNTRWVVWTWVAMTVVCLAANVGRIVPPENAIQESRALDRIVTAAFAVGLTTILFPASVTGVTVTALGALPMLMVTLGREPASGLAVGALAPLLVWVFVALVALHDQAQRLKRTRAPGVLAAGRREWALRLATLAGVLVLAVALRVPIERGIIAVQKKLLGMVLESPPSRRGGGRDLQLGQAVPHDFGKRMRVAMVVRAPYMPGYLRESAFTVYRSGRWLAPVDGVALQAAEGRAADGGGTVYPLVPATGSENTLAWRVEVLAPRMLEGVCLPGPALTLRCDGPAPLAETNGSVTAKELFPERYDLRVVPRLTVDSAYPLPDGRLDPAYVAVPAALEGAVSNWVAQCEGLAAAPTAAEAVPLVERFFATRFTYRLGLWLKPTPDPLVDFMSRRAGSCTHFASAGALMLRHCGFPARVIGGYACSEWNPLLSRWVVRERDGHAWVEVWDAGEGRWLLCDPTPPAGHPSALQKPGRTRLALDWVLALWNRFLYTLKNANLLGVIADAGGVVFLFLWHVIWSPGGAVVLVGFMLIGLARRRLTRRRRSADDRLRADLTAAMERLARRAGGDPLRRRSSESWAEWLRRAAGALPSDRAVVLGGLTERYQALRYRPRLDASAARDWLLDAERALR